MSYGHGSSSLPVLRSLRSLYSFGRVDIPISTRVQESAVSFPWWILSKAREWHPVHALYMPSLWRRAELVVRIGDTWLDVAIEWRGLDYRTLFFVLTKERSKPQKNGAGFRSSQCRDNTWGSAFGVVLDPNTCLHLSGAFNRLASSFPKYLCGVVITLSCVRNTQPQGFAFSPVTTHLSMCGLFRIISHWFQYGIRASIEVLIGISCRCTCRL